MNHRRATTLSKGLDVFGAVEELHNLSAKEMNKLLRDSQHLFTLRLRTGRGSYIRVNLERLVSRLPLHLLACLASRGAEPRLRYLLRGVRLLHSLSDLALRHPKLEQSFLQEVKIREQILDLIIYMLITLAGPEQEGRHGSSFTIFHAALVACSLHLLPAFVAGEWSDLVPVLLMHPKVDIFMDVAFDAVRRDIGLLQIKLRGLNSKLMSNRVSATVAESMAEVIAQQCEASVQVLQSLCQPHAFRDKVLNHKELCRNGGALRLALAVLKLHVPFLLAESKYLVSLVARLKSKVLSLMVKFCETESVSFLDEVAADARTMHLAETVASEVLALVRNALLEEARDFQESEDEDDEVPSGLLYIHAMRLADIFSDDSNFRNFVMDYIAPDLAKVLAQAPTIFLSGWCGSSATDEIKPGSDSVLIYDPFRAAGAAMHSFKSSGGSSTRGSGSTAALLPDDSSGCSLSAGQLQFASYSQERSSLFVKILANLHCFNPEICPADEKHRFLSLFVECLMVGPFIPGNSAFFLSTVQTAVRVCENLFSLLDHVSSLSSEAVSDEDLQLVSTFYNALHDAICPSAISEDSMQEDPVVAYVKDAHEQKRKVLLAQWQKSERWKRIHLYEPSDDKEESNPGISINKTTSNSSSSQPAVDEHDTPEFFEETQSFGELSVAKRKREAFEAENEDGGAQARKREHSSQLWERDWREMEWSGKGAEMFTKLVMNAETDRRAFGKFFLKEADAEDVYVNEEDVDNAEPCLRGSKEEPDLAEHLQVQNKSNGMGAYQMEDAGQFYRNLREHITGRQPFQRENTGSFCRDIIEDITGKGSFQREETGSFHGDMIEYSDTAVYVNDKDASNVVEMDYGDYGNEIARDFEVARHLEKENKGPFQKEDTGPFHRDILEQSGAVECVIDTDAHNVVEMECGVFETNFEAAREDTGPSHRDFIEESDAADHENNKDVDNVVEMDCGEYKEYATSFEARRLFKNDAPENVLMKSENKEREIFGKDIVEEACAAGDADADDKVAKTRECGEYNAVTECDAAQHNESNLAENLPVKTENEEILCVQQNIDFKFELKVEELGVHEDAADSQAEGCQPCMDEVKKEDQQQYFSSPTDEAKISPLVEPRQEISQSDVDASQAREASQVSVLGSSQVCVPEESLVRPSNTSRICAFDASRVCAIPGANDHALGNFPLPNPILPAATEELHPRKRKRNIMSDGQMAVMENALKTEPYMQRNPDLIMQWTSKLNKMGPEISYQQLKNWLNNRKARLARQRTGDMPAHNGEVRVSVYNHDGSAPGSSTCSGSSNDPNRSTSEDCCNTRDSGSTIQTRKPLTSIWIPQCKLATEDIDAIMDFDVNAVNRSHMTLDLTAVNRAFMESDAYGKHSCDLPEMDLVPGSSHRSAPVKFVKCEAGQFVSLLDKDGKEAATGTLYQVEGVWQGKRIDEHGICIVRIMHLNVDKGTRLPHPSILTGSTFEEAEKKSGQMIVAWDTKRIFLIS